MGGAQIKENMGVWMMTERGSKKSKHYYEPKDIDTWFIACAESQKLLDPASIKNFYEKFIEVGKEVGMKIGKPQCTYLKEERDGKKREAEIDNLLKVCKKKGAQLFFCILSQADGNIYSKVKQAGDVKYGVHTQCLLSKNAKKPNPQLIGNVLLKVNAKLNGVNNVVKNKTDDGIMKEPTLILGGDVTHPNPGEHIKPSVAALVGSMNRNASRSVSLPAPVYFAHLAAFRARTHIMGNHEDDAEKGSAAGSDISANSLQSKIQIEPKYAANAQYYL